LPVRQKEFHRNLRREFAKMIQLLYAYCLVCTGTKYDIYQNYPRFLGSVMLLPLKLVMAGSIEGIFLINITPFSSLMY